MPSLTTSARCPRSSAPSSPRSWRSRSRFRWASTWRVILPSARAGIFGATILALGRALGETITVTMIIGNQYVIPHTIFQPAYTLSSVIANEFTEATGTLHPAALVELGLVLILVTLVVNVLALIIVRSSAREARL